MVQISPKFAYLYYYQHFVINQFHTSNAILVITNIKTLLRSNHIYQNINS